MYSGRWLDAATAQQWGLVNHITAPEALHDAAFDYCANLARKSRPGLATMKELALVSRNLPLADGLRLEQERVVKIMEGPDPQEGIAAFLGKRPPNFTG